MDILEILQNLANQTGFANLTWGNYLMIAVALVFLYLAIGRGYEPLLLVPISFGMLLVNMYPSIMAEPVTTFYNAAGEVLCYLRGHEYTNVAGEILSQPVVNEIMLSVDPAKTMESTGGLLHYFFLLDEWAILPSLIFISPHGRPSPSIP